MGYAIFMALVMTGVAGTIGIYIRHKIWGIANKPKTVLEYGRAWAAYIAFIVPMASIHNFIQQGFAEGLVRFFILIIFYPLIAFGVGCFWGWIATAGKASKNNLQPVYSSSTFSNVEPASELHKNDEASSVDEGLEKFNVAKKLPIQKAGIDISGTDEWNLAIKYDDNLREDYQKLVLINEKLAKEFQKEITFKNLIADYKVLYEIYVKKAIGMRPGENEYSKNELINEIIIVVSKQSPEIAKEILELVRIYRFEEITDYSELADKLYPLLKKIEQVNQIEIIKNLKKIDLSSNLLTKYGAYIFVWK